MIIKVANSIYVYMTRNQNTNLRWSHNIILLNIYLIT